MKIRVTIVGVLEAEAELPEAPSVSALGTSRWEAWSTEQFRNSIKFIEECAKQAIEINKDHRLTLHEPPGGDA